MNKKYDSLNKVAIEAVAVKRRALPRYFSVVRNDRFDDATSDSGARSTRTVCTCASHDKFICNIVCLRAGRAPRVNTIGVFIW